MSLRSRLTDFRPDLEKVDVPTLVIHGDGDQIVPFEIGGKRSAELFQVAVLTVYGAVATRCPTPTATACTPTYSISSNF